MQQYWCANNYVLGATLPSTARVVKFRAVTKREIPHRFTHVYPTSCHNFDLSIARVAAPSCRTVYNTASHVLAVRIHEVYILSVKRPVLVAATCVPCIVVKKKDYVVTIVVGVALIVDPLLPLSLSMLAT